MTTVATIAGIVPGLQATALVAENLKHVKMNLKPSKQMKVSPKKMVNMGMTNLIGVSFIRPTAQIISTL